MPNDRDYAQQHEYMRRLLLAVENGMITRQEIADVSAAHDGRCKLDRGGFCDCDPDITFSCERGLFKIGPAGEVTRVHG